MSLGQELDFKYLMQNQQTIGSHDIKSERIVEYDFKIVSFRIGNEYYGIDIMKVKSILKNDKFTRVPNVLDFVIGVFSLRGEILPVIDLAKMFNLESTETENKLKAIIIIKVDNLLIGLIVDQIKNVIPLSRSNIQPPSPLLGSINERYIDGVVEVDERLYVILDTDAIFSDKEKTKKEILPQSSDLNEEFFTFFSNQVEELCSIHVNDFNKHRMRELFDEYVKKNNVTEMPRLNSSEATNMLAKLQSKHTGEFWKEPYVGQFLNAVSPKLNRICSEEIKALDLGCGNGYEAFSIYFMLHNEFREADVKMVAADSNLMAISNASRMEIGDSELPPWINRSKYLMNVSDNSYRVKKDVIDKIYFEFHNIQNIATYKKLFHLVIARDLSLYLKESDYNDFIDNIHQKIVSGGILILGDHEVINSPRFERVTDSNISIYLKK